VNECDENKALPDQPDPVGRFLETRFSGDRRSFIKAALLAVPVVVLLTTRTASAQGSTPVSGAGS
jgi:hypothetical protein